MGQHAGFSGRIVRTKGPYRETDRQGSVDMEASTWKQELAVVKATIKLTMKTGRFDTSGESNS